jgi:hypothetical protein
VTDNKIFVAISAPVCETDGITKRKEKMTKTKIMLAATGALLVLPIMSANAAIVSQAYTGDKTNLTTTDKTTLVNAINEVNSGVAANTTNITSLDSRVTTVEGDITTIEGNISTINNNITNLGTDTTAEISGAISGEVARSDTAYAVKATEGVASGAASGVAVNAAAITAVSGVASGAASGVAVNATNIGTLSSLTTTAQGSTVAAINEVNAIASGAASGVAANTTAISNINTNITNLTSGVTDEISGAISGEVARSDTAYAVKATEGVASGAASGVAVNAAAITAVSGVASGAASGVAVNAAAIGTLGSLTTTAQGSTVAAINEVVTKLPPAPSACLDTTNYCVLTSNGVTYAWEVIAR